MPLCIIYIVFLGLNYGCRAGRRGRSQVRVLAESYLQEHGHQTRSASTVPEALALLDSGELIDILFTDIGLKGDIHAGLELAKEAREQRPDLKVLYTTGQGVTALFVEGFWPNLNRRPIADLPVRPFRTPAKAKMKGRSYVRLAGIAGPVPTLVPVHSPSSFRGRRGGVPAIINAFGQPLDTPKSPPKFFAAKRLSGLSADAAVSGVLLVSMLLNGGYGYEPEP